MGTSASALLEAHLLRAAQALEALAGNQSLCAIARSGESFPAAKFGEGAVSALAEVRREVRRGAGAGGADLAGLAGALAQRWHRQAVTMADAGPDWAAYLRGGEDALTALAEELSGGAGPDQSSAPS